MQIQITPSRASGRVCAPPSKSVAHRLLILAAFADGISEISNLPLCEDVLATLDCLKALGVQFKLTDNKITVYGKPVHALSPVGALPCRESASTLRLLLPIAALTASKVCFTASEQLLSRPMHVYEQLFARLGWLYEKNTDGYTVCGGELPGETELCANVSSQFVSGILLAYAVSGKGGRLLLMTAPSSRPYIELTLGALRRFGVDAVWENEREIRVLAAPLTPISAQVEGDYSAAANLDAFNSFGGEVIVEGLSDRSHQGDRVYKGLFALLSRERAEIDIDTCPDLGPILFALAAAKHGAIFHSIARLRIKESDRISAMAEELHKLGARFSINENSLEIFPCKLHSPTTPLDSHGDHRIAMALIPLLSLVGGSIRGVEATGKSFPDYLTSIRALGIEAKEIQ